MWTSTNRRDTLNVSCLHPKIQLSYNGVSLKGVHIWKSKWPISSFKNDWDAFAQVGRKLTNRILFTCCALQNWPLEVDGWIKDGKTVSHPYGRRNLGLHNISDVDDHLTTSDTSSDYRWCQIHFQCYNALSLFCVWSTTSNTINSNINSRAISSSCQDRNAYMKRSFDNSECS